MNYRQNAREKDPDEDVIIDPKRFLPKFNIRVPTIYELCFFGLISAMIFSFILMALSDPPEKAFHSDCFKSHVWHHKEKTSAKNCGIYDLNSPNIPDNCIQWVDTIVCDERIVAGAKSNIIKTPLPPWEARYARPVFSDH